MSNYPTKQQLIDIMGDAALKTKTALGTKQDTLTFDATPTAESTNPVTSGGVKAALDLKLDTTQKGAANGVAELDAQGKIPASQIPGAVDDVIDAYYYNGQMYKDAAHTQLITGESDKIYIDITDDKNIEYRWSGTVYAVVSESLALGETAQTAYAGNKGKKNADDIAAIQAVLPNKQDTLTFDSTPTEGSTNPVTSGGLHTKFATKQDNLTFDSAPTAGSSNPVTSAGVKTALDAKQDTLTFDAAPTENSTNPVYSGGVFTGLAGKVDKVTGKQLSTEDYTTEEKNKLAGIVDLTSAEVQDIKDAFDLT